MKVRSILALTIWPSSTPQRDHRNPPARWRAAIETRQRHSAEHPEPESVLANVCYRIFRERSWPMQRKRASFPRLSSCARSNRHSFARSHTLPAPLKRLHEPGAIRSTRGESRITRSQSINSCHLPSSVFGFPPEYRNSCHMSAIQPAQVRRRFPAFQSILQLDPVVLLLETAGKAPSCGDYGSRPV